jgi:hypothetical protein
LVCTHLGLRRLGIIVSLSALAAILACVFPAGLRADRPNGHYLTSSDVHSGGFNGHPYTLQELVDLVTLDELERIVRGLSGADTVYIDGAPVALETRYAYAGQKHEAFQYLWDEVSALGYQPEVQTFMLSTTRPDLTGLAVANSADTVWVGSDDGIVYRAWAFGGWIRFREAGNTYNEIFDIYVDPAGRLWAACGLTGGNLGALFISLDGALSWSRRISGINIYTLRSIIFSNESYGFACGAIGTVLRTVNGGVSWLPIPASTFRYLSLNAVTSSGPMRFWIAASAGYLFETENLGSVWVEHKLDTYNMLNAIDFADSLHGVVVGTGVAYYTTDGGESWSETSVVPPPGVQPDLRSVAMYDSLRVVAAGGAGKIFVSEDGGASWSPLEGDCTGDDDVAEVAFLDRDVFWTAGRDEVRRIDIALPEVECRHYQFGDTIWGKNIYFRVEGHEAPSRRVVICAHYDAISETPYVCAPGADDNATGVAGVLASARALHGARLSRTVEFVLFDAEEVGLRGSRHFAGNLEEGVIYDGVINLDMLGYDYKRDWSLKVAGRSHPDDMNLGELVMAVIDSLDLQLVPDYTMVPNLTSDHYSFHEVGVPGIMLIESERDELNPAYHSCGDVADKIVYDYLTECVKAALGSVAFLAGYAFYEPEDSTVNPVVLYQNWPNPFTDGTRISFVAPETAPVELAVYDVLGRLVTRLEPFRVAQTDSGYVDWDGSNRGGRQLASGVYFVRLRVGSAENVRKAVLVR